MTTILIIFGLFCLLSLLLPKGIIFHELTRLPLYWLNMIAVSTTELFIEKYRYGPHRKQYLYYLSGSVQPSGKKNVIIYLHGGGWRFGSPEAFRPNAKFFVERGFDVFMPAHRKTPRFGYESQIADMGLAVSKILEILKDKGLENRKIIIGGISSGGNLSALLLYHREILKYYDISLDRFSGIFLLAAPLNIRMMRQTFIIRSFAGRPNQPTYAKANPYDQLTGREKLPHLVVHGEKDGLVNYSSTLSFADRYNYLNPGYLQFHTIKNGTHLDAGKWMFRKDEVGQVLAEWLGKIETSS